MDPIDDNEFDQENQDQDGSPEVEVTPQIHTNGANDDDAQITNGNGNGYHEPVPQNPAVARARATGAAVSQRTTTTTERFLTPQPSINVSNPLMNRINNRSPHALDAERNKSDRAFLDDLIIKPECVDYILVPHRVLPMFREDGTPVKTGKLTHKNGEMFSIEVISYDELQAEILKAWGGGQYRINIYSRNDGKIVQSIQRCILISIPTNTYPPKAEEYEDLTPQVLSKGAASDSEESEDLRRERKELKDAQERERIAEAKRRLEEAQRKAEIRSLLSKKEIKELENELKNGKKDDDMNPQLEALKTQIADDRRRQEERDRIAVEERKEEKRRYDDEIKEERRRREDEAKETVRQRESDRQRHESEMRLLLEKMNQPKDDKGHETLMALIAATLGKPQPPDNSKDVMIELSKAHQAANAQIMSAVLTKKDDGSPMLDNMMKIFNRENSTAAAMTNNLITALITRSKEKEPSLQTAMELIKFMNDQTGGMTAGAAELAGPEMDGYDPKIGFLGNAGRALFDILKQMATRPELMDMVANIVGRNKPTNDDIAMAARRIEQNGFPVQQALPSLGNRDYQGMPSAIPAGPPPLPQRQIPQPQPMSQQQRIAPQQVQQQPVQQRTNPAQQPVANAQADVASELEGTASGLPTNGDPTMTPIEEELTPEQLAAQNLIANISDTLATCINEIKTAKPQNERRWPEHATETWNRTFIQKLVNEPSEAMRFNAIRANCEPDIWNELLSVLNGNPAEYQLFNYHFRRFMDMNVAPPVVPQQSEPIVQQQPPPTATPAQ